MKKGNEYKTKTVTPDLTVYVSTYTSTVQTQLLGVYEGLFYVKEITSASVFNYAVIFMDPNNIAVTTLYRRTMPALTFPAGDPRQGLTFSRFLEYSSQNLYILFTSATRSQIHAKNIGASGVFQSFNLIANTEVTFTAGKRKLIFDGVTNKYYQWTSDTALYTARDGRTTTAGTQFGLVLYGNTRDIQFLGDNFAIVTYTGTTTIKASYGWYMGPTTLRAHAFDQTSTMVPKIHSNQANLIFITTNIFSYSKINSAGAFSNLTFAGLVSGSAQLTQARTDFTNALKVSFDIQKIFALNAAYVAIYELSTLSASPNTVTANKISQVSLSSDAAAQITGSTSYVMKMQIKCVCVSTKVSSFACFSTTLNCMALLASTKQTCTAAYVDALPQFV